MDMFSNKGFFGTFGIMAVVTIVANLALLAGEAWVVVKVLTMMGVLPLEG